MRKKLKKLCALVLSAVTVLSILPSSGLVNAETDTDITAEESVQSTVYFKVPNPSGQVIVTSNADTDEEVIQTITVDEEKTTLTDNDGNTSDVTLTQEGYCLELTEEVGETVNLEFVASDGYEVGTYHIISDAGDENELVEEITLSDDNKYEYTFTDESQVLEVTFTAIETEDVNTQEDTVPVDESKTTPVKEEEPTSEEETTIPEGAETMENNESLISITEGFDYSTIADLRCDYSERDWSKYGIDDSTIEYYKEKGIDILTDETHGSHLEDRLKKTSSNKLRTANAKSASYYVGQQISGTANITSVYYDSSNGQSYFWFNLGGNLSGWGLTANAWCADHTAAEPPVGHPIISVTATITKIENGYAYANVLLTPQGVTDGVSRDEYGRLYGYQHIAGTIRIPYQPTGSGDDSDEVSETKTSTAINSLSASARAYNIFDHIGQTVNVQTWHQSQDTDSYKISWVNSNGVVKHKSKQGRLGVVSKLQPPGTYNDDYLLQVMWCGDADISMRTGTRVVRNLATYSYTGYTQTRLKQAAALFYWWDSHYGDKVSSFQNYYVKQAIVWWIKGSSESGKQGNTPYANWDNTSLRAKQKELWSTGLSWAKSNYQYFVVKAVLLTGENQPLFNMTYTYEPTVPSPTTPVHRVLRQLFLSLPLVP